MLAEMSEPVTSYAQAAYAYEASCQRAAAFQLLEAPAASPSLLGDRCLTRYGLQSPLLGKPACATLAGHRGIRGPFVAPVPAAPVVAPMKAPPPPVASRRRVLGQRTFQLWVEDCMLEKGVRVYAKDEQSLAGLHLDLTDACIQHLFSRYWSRLQSLRGVSGEVEAAEEGANEQALAERHSEDLCEFLECLLDSVYIEMDDVGGTDLVLRVPETIEPRPPLQVVERAFEATTTTAATRRTTTKTTNTVPPPPRLRSSGLRRSSCTAAAPTASGGCGGGVRRCAIPGCLPDRRCDTASGWAGQQPQQEEQPLAAPAEQADELLSKEWICEQLLTPRMAFGQPQTLPLHTYKGGAPLRPTSSSRARRRVLEAPTLLVPVGPVRLPTRPSSSPPVRRVLAEAPPAGWAALPAGHSEAAPKPRTSSRPSSARFGQAVVVYSSGGSDHRPGGGHPRPLSACGGAARIAGVAQARPPPFLLELEPAAVPAEEAAMTTRRSGPRPPSAALLLQACTDLPSRQLQKPDRRYSESARR